MQWVEGGSRGIHTETSVQIKNRAMDSMEHFPYDTRAMGMGDAGFGTLTEVEGGGRGGGAAGGVSGGVIPKVLLASSQGHKEGIP